MAKKSSHRRKSVRAPKSRKGVRNTTGLVPFKKGQKGLGRPKGAKNKFGVRLKEAILEAAEASGRDGKGKDGAVGYLVWLSRAEPAVFGRMLEKVMPLQVDVHDKTDRSLSAQEAVDRLTERGLPVPPALRSLAEGVARAVQERQDEDYDDELDGRGYEGADESLADETAGAGDGDDVQEDVDDAA